MKQQRVNTRLLLFLLGGAIALGVGLFAVREFQLRRNVPFLLRQAQYALDDQDFPRANRYLETYLSYPNADISALAKYGLDLEKRAQQSQARAQAFAVLEHVVERQPKLHDVRYRLIWCALTLQYLDDARKHAQLLLPHWHNQAELHHIIAWCQNAVGEHEKAVETYARAIAADPKRIEAHLLRAEILYRRLGRPEDAEAAYAALVTTNPESYRSFLGRAWFYLRRGQFPEAASDIKAAQKLAADNSAVLLAAMEIAQARGDLAAARAYGEQGRAKHLDDARFCKALAGLELRAGDRTAALQAIEDGLKTAPDDADLLVARADLLVEDGRIAEAKQVLAQLRHDGPEAKYIAAGIAYAERRWAETIIMLEKLRGEVRTDAALSSRINTLLGFCYERIHAADQRTAAFQKALSQDPELSAARAGLAAALLDEGRIDQAIATLQLLRNRTDTTKGVLVLLARAHLMRVKRIAPSDRKWHDLEGVLAEADRKAPGAPELAVLRAEMLLLQKRPDDAAALIKQALESDQTQTLLWSALADLAARDGLFDRGAKLLDDAERFCGDNVELRLARLRLLLAKGGVGSQSAAVRQVQNLSPFDHVQQLQLLRGAAVVLEQHDAGQLARPLWYEIARLQPHDVGSRQRLFELALAANQYAEAGRLLDALRALEGNNSVFHLHGQAAIAIQQAQNPDKRASKLRDAKQYLLELNRRRPDWPQLPSLQARIAEMEGDTDTAINRYLAALDRGERQPQQVLRLARLLCERRRYLDADRALRTLEEFMPVHGPLARLGAEVALRNQDPLRAVIRALQAVKPNTNDYRDLLWLADVFARAGSKSEAEQTLRRAVEVGGHVPDTWIALVRHFRDPRQRAEAVRLLDRLKDEMPADLVETTVARCHEALGDLDRATALFDKAVAEHKMDLATLIFAAEFYLRAGENEKAQACFTALLQPEARTPADDTAWARRELAVLLAGRDVKNHNEALELLRKNTAIAGETLADQRARLYIDGLQPKNREQAIRQLTSSFERSPATADEQFRLLRLCEQASQRELAASLGIELLLANPNDARLLAHQTRRLIVQERLADAQIHLDRLTRLEPQSERTRQLAHELTTARSTITSANNP